MTMTATATRIAFRAEAKAFADAVGWVARQLPAKPNPPVLGGAVLTVADGRLTVSGFDYDVATRASLDVEGGVNGVALVSARLLAGVSAGFPNKPVDVRHEGNYLHVTCGTAKLRLPLMAIGDYPTLPDHPTVVSTVDAATFVDAVAVVEFTASREIAHKNLMGVQLAFDGSQLTLTATNRYIAAIRKLACTGGSGSAVVLADTLASAVKGFRRTGEVHIALSAGLIGLSDSDRSVTARLLDGSYPNMDARMPVRQDAPARFEVAELTNALRQADKVRAPKTPALLTFTNGVLTVTAGDDPDAPGGYSEDLIADTSGYAGAGALTVRVNPEYLLGGLNALGTTTADMHLSSPRQPALLTAVGEGLPDYRFMFMPIRPGEPVAAPPVPDATRASMRKKLEQT